MIRKIKYTILALFGFLALRGQVNLVPNGSFEEYYQLPNNEGQINLSKYWFTPTLGTPDYYSLFSDSSSGFRIPESVTGYQYPFQGNFYAGLYIYNKLADYGVEYIEVKLISPLISQKCYCVSFYISIADSLSSYSVNNIGAYLSQDSIYINETIRLSQFVPQIQNININPLIDKINWTIISGNFLANGGEQYITIGNFNLPEYDDTLCLDNTPHHSDYGYFYIDSVSVKRCDEVGLEEKPIGEIKIYPNPAQDFVSIELPKNYTQAQLAIYNLTGQLISQKQLTQLNQTIPITELGNGMYIFVIQNEDKVIGRQRVIVAR